MTHRQSSIPATVRRQISLFALLCTGVFGCSSIAYAQCGLAVGMSTIPQAQFAVGQSFEVEISMATSHTTPVEIQAVVVKLDCVQTSECFLQSCVDDGLVIHYDGDSTIIPGSCNTSIWSDQPGGGAVNNEVVFVFQPNVILTPENSCAFRFGVSLLSQSQDATPLQVLMHSIVVAECQPGPVQNQCASLSIPIVNPAISIVKEIDRAGPICNGDTASYIYTVTNTGSSVSLSNVIVIDDNGTPGNPSDDFSPTFIGGDVINNGMLEPIETWVYMHEFESQTPGVNDSTVIVSCDYVNAAGAVNVEDADGLTVDVHPRPSCSIQSTIDDCQATYCVVTDACEPYTVVWSGPGGFSHNEPCISLGVGDAAGSYVAQLIDCNGCTPVNSCAVQINPLSLPSAVISVSDCPYPQFLTVTANNCSGCTYQWGTGTIGNCVALPNQTASTLVVTAPGDYCVTVTAFNGCEAMADVTVEQCIQTCTLQSLSLASPVTNGNFGHSMDRSSNVLAIGSANGPNRVDLYQWTGSTWQPLTQLIPSDGFAGQFGYALDFSSSGDLLIVGAPATTTTGIGTTGAAYVYRRISGIWFFEAVLRASDATSNMRFGESVSIDGDNVLIGAPQHGNPTNSGAAYFFRRIGSVWTQGTKFTSGQGAQSFCGRAVALFNDRALVGTLQSIVQTNTSQLQRTGTTTWSVSGPILLGGSSIALGGPQSNPQFAALGDSIHLSNSGIVHLYAWTGTWTPVGSVQPNNPALNDEFGQAVAFNDAADSLIVGARFRDFPTNAGSAFLYKRNGSVWTFERTTRPLPFFLNMNFGAAVACMNQGSVLLGIVSATGEIVNNFANAGRVYVQVIDDEDCNENFMLDHCDIHVGFSLDVNANGVPDECKPPSACLADIAPPTGDGNVGVPDLLAVINAWGQCANPRDCPADIAPAPDGDGTVGVPDLLAIINAWGPCP